METPTVTDEWLSHHYNHLAPEVSSNVLETLERMRNVCPVAHSDQHGGFWVVTRYDDVFHVAQDWRTFSSEHGSTVPLAPISVRNIPVEVDPPLQRAYKRVLNSFLTPAVVAQWESETRVLVNSLIDEFIEAGQCEFMDAFARPFPSQAFFRFGINAPKDEIEKVAFLASHASMPHVPEAAQSWVDLAQWVGDFIEARKSEPHGDLVDGLLSAEIEGRPLTPEERIGMLQLVILGGLATTAGALGLMMLRFCAEPDIPAKLRANPELIPEAIEELLRLDTPFLFMARTAMQDTEIDGHKIKAGEQVMIYFASADRDENMFCDANKFDLERGANRHMAFGVGPHRCAGSNVARLNLKVALSEMLPRLHDLQLQPGAEIKFHATSTRSPLAVPITFTPGPRVTTGEGSR